VSALDARLGAVLEGLPELGTPLEARRLPTGWSNPVWWVRTSERALAVRVPRDAVVDRRREARVLDRAVAAGLTPAPLHLDVDTGVCVLPWVDRPPLSRRGPVGVRDAARLGAVVGRIHALPHSDLTPPDRRAAVRTLLETARAGGGDPDPGAGEAVDEVPVEGPLVLAHGDLNPDNLLVDDGRITVLDWEFAGPGDAALDLVVLAETAGLDADARAALFEAAGRTLPDAARLEALCRVHALEQYAWACAALATRGADLPDADGVRAQREAARRRLGLSR
jgi:aminoglycoside phosphotransferase (APT) family kinase protein